MGQAHTASDSRLHERHALKARVSVLPAAGEPLLATARNVSFGGLALVLGDGALAVGIEVVVEIQDEAVPALRGVICWRRGDEVGVRFDELRRAARLALADLVVRSRRVGA